MAIQKNFVIHNGLEVNDNLIFADTGSGKVGIATTNPQNTLDVKGGIGATYAYISGDINFDGKLGISSNYGLNGAYLVSTGTGVTWSSLPGLRTSQTYTAGVGQSSFNFSYNPSVGVDVYVNGVRLSSSEYSALDGITVILDDACFSGDTVDLIAYSVSGLGVGNTGISGLSVLNNGVSVGNDGNITSLNFVGAGVTRVGFGVSIALDSLVATYANNAGVATYSNFAGISTYADTSGISTYANNAGVATDVIGGIASVSQLYVNVGVSTLGIVTASDIYSSGIVTATSGFISVANTTPIQISLEGNQLIFTAVGIGSTTLTLYP